MLEDWDKQFTHCVGSTRKKCFLPCSIWVKEKKIFPCIKCFISKADQIGTQHTSLFVVNAIDSFISWVGDLFNVFRNFNLWLEFAFCVLNSSQFIYTAKGWAVLRGNKIRSDTPGRNCSALHLEIVDQKFIQVVGSGNDSILESGVIQHLTRLFRKISEITGVKADTVALRFDACFAHLGKNTDRIRNTGFQCVISIDKQCTCIRIQSCIFFKCSIFIFESHDPTVCMRSHNRYIKHFAGEYIGSSDASTDHSSSCSVQSRIRSLGAAKSELHDTVSLCRINNTGSFRSDQALMIQNCKNCSLNKLSLHDRSYDFQKRFSWEDDASLRDRINVSAKMKSAQIMKKILTEQSEPS